MALKRLISNKKLPAVVRTKQIMGKLEAKGIRMPGQEPCPKCGDAMVETYCKIVCANCGYMQDCNDQW